jgi:hypothetical protein
LKTDFCSQKTVSFNIGQVNDPLPGISTGLTESAFTKGSSSQLLSELMIEVFVEVFLQEKLMKLIKKYKKNIFS